MNAREESGTVTAEPNVYIDFVSEKLISSPKAGLLRAMGANADDGRQSVAFSHTGSLNGLGSILVDRDQISPMRGRRKCLNGMNSVCLGMPGTRYKVDICTKLPENGRPGKYTVIEMTAEEIREMKDACYESFRSRQTCRPADCDTDPVSYESDDEFWVDYEDPIERAECCLSAHGFDADYLDFLPDDEKYELFRENFGW